MQTNGSTPRLRKLHGDNYTTVPKAWPKSKSFRHPSYGLVKLGLADASSERRALLSPRASRPRLHVSYPTLGLVLFAFVEGCLSVHHALTAFVLLAGFWCAVVSILTRRDA